MTDYLLQWQRDNNENGRREDKPVLCKECKGEVHWSDFFKKWQPKAVSRWLSYKLCRRCHMEGKK